MKTAISPGVAVIVIIIVVIVVVAIGWKLTAGKKPPAGTETTTITNPDQLQGVEEAMKQTEAQSDSAAKPSDTNVPQ
ncbi:MAG: hypothetical protein ACUVX8_10760 [Candidatus Zipacnadales bacterium]